MANPLGRTQGIRFSYYESGARRLDRAEVSKVL
jgi:hypothetical protein